MRNDDERFNPLPSHAYSGHRDRRKPGPNMVAQGMQFGAE